MSAALVPLAVLMLLVTYPSRALPMLAPGIDRLPSRVAAYLRLAGPAALAALAAVNALFPDGTASSFRLGLLPGAVVLCAIVVAWRHTLLPGVVVAVVVVAVGRAAGLA